MSNELYEVTVWNVDGNIIKKMWRATNEDVEDVADDFSDDPSAIVEVSRRGPVAI